MAKTVKQKIKAKGKEFHAPKQKSDASGRDLDLVFDDINGIEVELLALDDLPGSFQGNPVTWFNNFAVKKNGAYLKKSDNVAYTLHFDPIPTDTQFIYYDGQDFHTDISPEPSDRPGKSKVTFMIGDPGTGWVKPG